jgi:hypothetical protein
LLPNIQLKTIQRSAQSFENSIIGRVDSTFYFGLSLTEGATLNLSNKFWMNLVESEDPVIISGGLVTRIAYEYKILLDNVDVSDKIKSCDISYGIDKYCGEVDIKWADYSVYSKIDCSNITLNYKKKRIVVYTKITGVTDWVCQGSFYLEKRSISVTSSGIEVGSWGRNEPALLSSPYAKPLSQKWETDTTAVAIATEIVGGLVTLSWGIMDYIILGGNVSAENEQPIDVISKLAAPVGGIFSADRSGHLKVIYRFMDI